MVDIREARGAAVGMETGGLEARGGQNNDAESGGLEGRTTSEWRARLAAIHTTQIRKQARMGCSRFTFFQKKF